MVDAWAALGKTLVKPLDLLYLAPESWRPMETSSGRTSNRTSERELDRIPMTARCTGVEAPVRLWDYSPFGFAILAAPGIQGGFSASQGQAIELSLDLGDQRVAARCTIENLQPFRGSLRLGLRRRDMDELPAIGAPGTGILLPEDCHVAAETLNPLLYGEWCPLKLIGIQQGLRMAFQSSDPSLVLFKGQQLRVDLSLPSAVECTVIGRITSLGRSEESQVMILEPSRMPAGLPGALAEFLTFEAHLSPDSLKPLGFPVRFMRDRLDFRYAETPADFDRVSELRALAIRDAYSVEVDPAHKDSVPAISRSSKVLCAFHEGRLVGAATLTYPGKDTWRPNSLRALSDEDYRAWEANLDELLEVHGVCLHPDYRRGDLLKALIEQIARAFVLSDRKYILKLCDERSLARFRKMGFREAGTSFEGRNGPQRPVLLDKEAVTHAKGINRASWLALFGDLGEDLLDRRLVEPDAWSRWKLRALLSLRPLLRDRRREKAESIFGELLMNKESGKK